MSYFRGRRGDKWIAGPWRLSDNQHYYNLLIDNFYSQQRGYHLRNCNVYYLCQKQRIVARFSRRIYFWRWSMKHSELLIIIFWFATVSGPAFFLTTLVVHAHQCKSMITHQIVVWGEKPRALALAVGQSTTCPLGQVVQYSARIYSMACRSTKKKGSKNRSKATKRLGSRPCPCGSTTTWLFHKQARELVRFYDVIYIEDLRVKNMIDKSNAIRI